MRIALAAGVTASVLMFFVLAVAADRTERDSLVTDVLGALIVGVIVGLLVLLWSWAV